MTIETKLLVIVIGFIAGCVFLWWSVKHERKSPDMDMTWYAISQRKQSILWKIHNIPCGEDSPEIDKLWQEYEELEILERRVSNENY